MERRIFLKKSVAYSVLGVAVSAGFVVPKSVVAAWPKTSFEAKNNNDALKNLFGASNYIPSDDIKIKAPEIAENGAVVPITISSSVPGIESIAILIEKNPAPLAASFNMAETSQGFISTRVKMSKTSPVLVVVKAEGKQYGASKIVKVTIGGCGG